MDFLDLLEIVVRETKPDFSKFKKPTNLDSPLSEEDTGLDSLDIALVITVIGEIYQVPMAALDKARDIRTTRDVLDLVEREGERIPETIEEAKGYIE
jgi:acyl carrier protein